MASTGWRFDNSYLRLPAALYERCHPVPVCAPRLAIFNRKLAEDLGLDPDILESGGGAAVLSGNRIPEGSEPIAQAYAGHQFGHFTMLGDGRAVLLGEHIAPGGGRWDIQLKGSGQTPFSRRGDGRAALGPMLREFLISEAIHALGIPTTRSLAVVATGEPVFREEPLPGAVLTRVAASHIRVGTFEYAAALEDRALLVALADYTLQRHFPEHAGASASRLLESAIDRQAALVARWLLVGFVHGVMNTDNMALSGETIDYGPCAFLDTYDPSTVFSSIDVHGRYAYGSQPDIAHWNLARLAESLLPLLHTNPGQAVDLAKELFGTFPSAFRQYWHEGIRKKIGLFSQQPGDDVLVEGLLTDMTRHGADFTNTFRGLRAKADDVETDAQDLGDWLPRWRKRLRDQTQSPAEAQALMHQNNPAVIPRNHLVEEALDAAVKFSDLSPLRRLLAALQTPYEDNPAKTPFLNPPPPGKAPYRTFCGT